MNLIGARRVALRERGEQSNASDRRDYTKRGPSQREHEILDEQETPEPRDTRAERRTDDELRLAPHAAHERQVDDIRRRDDEHERGCGHEHPERQTRLLADRLLERNDRDAI